MNQHNNLSHSSKTSVVLAAHGVPARDYPRSRVGLLMALEMSPLGRLPGMAGVRSRLDAQVRDWPRTPASDPYKAAVDELTGRLEADLGLPVFVGYNEFCAPTIAQALDRAVAAGAERVIVIPTMLLRGNEHTEAEIASAVQDARLRHAQSVFEYAWPFDLENMTALFVTQVRATIGEPSPD